MNALQELNKKIDRLEIMIFGHDQPGLKDTVVRLDESVKNCDCSIRDLMVVVSGLVKFMDETRGKDKIRAQMANTIKWLVGSLITISIALITIVISLLM